MMIKIILIFLAAAILITILVQAWANYAKNEICTHTQLQELQKSGDYYSCLKEIK